MMVKTEKLYFKNGYELKPITQQQAESLELNSQVYIKINGVAHPAKIVKCFENAEKFTIELL